MTHEVILSFRFLENEGWTEADLWKTYKLLDVLDRTLDNLVQVPGMETAFPRSETRGPHCHRSFLLARNALAMTRRGLGEEIVKLGGKRP